MKQACSMKLITAKWILCISEDHHQSKVPVKSITPFCVALAWRCPSPDKRFSHLSVGAAYNVSRFTKTPSSVKEHIDSVILGRVGRIHDGAKTNTRKDLAQSNRKCAHDVALAVILFLNTSGIAPFTAPREGVLLERIPEQSRCRLLE